MGGDFGWGAETGDGDDGDAGGAEGREKIGYAGVIHVNLFLPNFGAVVSAATNGETRKEFVPWNIEENDGFDIVKYAGAKHDFGACAAPWLTVKNEVLTSGTNGINFLLDSRREFGFWHHTAVTSVICKLLTAEFTNRAPLSAESIC